MLNFDALLFDLDGTLLDTAPDFITALKTQLRLHGREPMDDHIIPQLRDQWLCGHY